MAVTADNHDARTSKTQRAIPETASFLARKSLQVSASFLSPYAVSLDPSLNAKQWLHKDEFVEGSLRLICYEEIDGRRWKYLAEKDNLSSKSSFHIVSEQANQTPMEELVSFIRSCVVPEGFPQSVTPSYIPYMTWRALQHFFGGAMGVFTTQTLLSSVGISRSHSVSGAVAINWILKDGAGRFGKMIFSRQGKKFDYDLKQLRFTGALLMQIGAAIELATAAVPHMFLPMACAANVAKNVSAVTSTSTRTPIYKAFARGENIGDVTAKGECIGNISDLLGTGFGILIAKRNPSLVTAFSLLSCGYIICSYKEVKSLVLSTLNHKRFGGVVQSFLETGRIPSLHEGNMKENIFDLPWSKENTVILGSRLKDAIHNPNTLEFTRNLFEKERYMVTYNPSKDKVHVLLKDQANPDDVLKAAFHAHLLLHTVCSTRKHLLPREQSEECTDAHPLLIGGGLEERVAESCNMVSALYDTFKSEVAAEGWMMSESLLNPGCARIILAD